MISVPNVIIVWWTTIKINQKNTFITKYKKNNFIERINLSFFILYMFLLFNIFFGVDSLSNFYCRTLKISILSSQKASDVFHLKKKWMNWKQQFKLKKIKQIWMMDKQMMTISMFPMDCLHFERIIWVAWSDKWQLNTSISLFKMLMFIMTL